MQIPSVLWVGLPHRREFSDIAVSVRDHAKIRFAPDLDHVANDAVPELVILAQSRPGEFLPSEVRELRQTWPKTLFVSLLGSWCEGEQRSGSPLPDVPRVYVSHWRQRVNPAELGSLRASLSNPEAEGLAARPSPPQAPLVAIYAASDSYRDALADVLCQFECKVVSARIETDLRLEGADAVLWEVPSNQECRTGEIRDLRQRHRRASIIGLLTFPREHEAERLRKIGVDHILAQPFPLEDLQKAIFSARPAISSAA